MTAASSDAHVVQPDRQKLEALDGLRGIAVLAVMASHFERFLPASGAWLPIKTIASYGWAGVDLFFALSGFLITGILVATRGSNNYFVSFFARRVLRIFPIYYLTLSGVLLLAVFFPGSADHLPPPAQRPFYFVYLTNWIPFFTGTWPPNVLGHFWSLAVEEQFYLVWPFVVALVSRGTLRSIAITVAIGEPVVRIAFLALHVPSAAIDLSTVTRVDSLVLGACGALLYARYRDEKRFPLVWWIAIPLALYVAGLCLVPSDEGRIVFYQSIGFSLLGIGFAALVTHLAFTDRQATNLQRFFRAPWLRRVGAYSYGMYIFHVPVLGICEIMLLRRLPITLQTNGFVSIAFVVLIGVLTFAIAAASYELFERRILGAKRFFRASSAPRSIA